MWNLYKNFNYTDVKPSLSFSTVPTPTVSIPPIQGTMVGSPQDIQCTVSTVSGVEFSSVTISWMGPGGDTIRNDSRVTISPTSGSDNNYTSSLQFMYLMEGDEGTYECSVMILETNTSTSMDLNTPASKEFANTKFRSSIDKNLCQEVKKKEITMISQLDQYK